jgi:hypothetical protein
MDTIIQINGFADFINEASDDSDLTSFRAQKNALDSLLELGLISKEEHRRDIRTLLNHSDKRFSSEAVSSVVKSAIESPEFKRITDLGLVNASSLTQMLNGNIVLAKPGYDRNQNYALGFFSELRVLRRLTPKRRFKSYYGGWNTLDETIKRFDTALSKEQFFKISATWAFDHLDFDAEFFPVKKRTAKGYFD